MKRLSSLLILSLFISSCSKDEDSNPTTPPSSNVKVTITPASSDINPGVTIQFKTTVTGATDQTVTWSVLNGPGSINSAGFYTAPATISVDPTTATIKAVSKADANASATATLRIIRPKVTDAKRVALGLSVPGYVYSTGEEAATLCAEAVFLASEINGGTQLITTGTLTQSTSNPNQFTYSATPNDKLRLSFTNGSTIYYTVTAFNGDFTSDAANFLRSSHSLSFRMVITGTADFTVSSQQTSTSRQASIRGSMTYENTPLTVDMTMQGSVYYEAGTSPVYDVDEVLQGSITASNLSISIDERRVYKSLYVTKFVQQTTRTINNIWTVDGVEFTMLNAVMKWVLADFKAVDLDTFWSQTSGVLTRSGASYGQLLFGTETGQALIWLQIGSEKIILVAHGI